MRKPPSQKQASQLAVWEDVRNTIVLLPGQLQPAGPSRESSEDPEMHGNAKVWDPCTPLSSRPSRLIHHVGGPMHAHTLTFLEVGATSFSSMSFSLWSIPEGTQRLTPSVPRRIPIMDPAPLSLFHIRTTNVRLDQA